MRFLKLRFAFGGRIWHAAVMVLAALVSPPFARGEMPAVAEIDAVTAALADFLPRIESRLSQAEEKLTQLIRLRAGGQASWREVAEQHVHVTSLKADRKAAYEFSAFVASLRESTNATVQERQVKSIGDQDDRKRLDCITLQLAAANAAASGDVAAEEVGVRRQQQRLAAVEKLAAKGFASDSEVAEARRALRAAQASSERLARDKLDHVRAYELLRESNGDRAFDNCVAANDVGEVRSEELPAKFFVNGTAVRRLLDLRRTRLFAAARRQAIAAQEVMLTELLGRWREAQRRGARVERDIESTRLDIEEARARQQAAEERVKILRLEEMRCVADCFIDAPEPDFVVGSAMESDVAWPMVAVDEAPLLFSTDLRPHRAERYSTSCDRTQPAVAWPTLRDFERSPCRDTVHRFSEPSYFDFYQSGIRRTDLPHRVRESFAPGSIPWYLPGSPTNFR